jgi:hypothetical protein
VGHYIVCDAAKKRVSVKCNAKDVYETAKKIKRKEEAERDENKIIDKEQEIRKKEKGGEGTKDSQGHDSNERA